MNNETFLIDNYDIELAQDICKNLTDEELRNRAVASVLGAKLSEKYFTDTEVDITTGLHNIGLIHEKIEISDIYIRNNYIDTRVYFNDNELCVPKSHFDNEITPLAYMFIKLNKDLSTATVTGFIMPTAIDTSIDYNGYYAVNESDLISYYDIETMISEGFTYDIDDEFLSQIFEYINEKIEDYGHFYRILIASKEARQHLKDTINANDVFKYISLNNEAINNDELEILDMTSEIDTLNTEEYLFGSLEENNTINSLETNNDLSINTDENFSLDSEFETLETMNLEEVDDKNIETREFLETEDNLENLIAEPIVELDKDFEDLVQDDILDVLDNQNLTQSFDESLIEDNTQVETSNIDSEQIHSNNPENSPSSFEFITEISPSLNTYETYDEITDENIEIEENNTSIEELQVGEINNNTEYELAIEESPNLAAQEENASITNENEIDVLFNDLTTEDDNDNLGEVEEDTTILDSKEIPYEDIENSNTKQQNKSSKILPLVGILALVATIGYFTSTKLMNSNNTLPTKAENNAITTQPKVEKSSNIDKEIAMPIETVENTATPMLTEEATTESIPAIEENLDASILISNLRVSWEIPVEYVSNSTVKRYFTKLGKIIQLNLKTEMLLLNKPPITNKILVELEYNKTAQKFGVKNITTSSGEITVDDLIKNTVNNSLNIDLNMDLSALNNVHGNPTLVINL